jgi:hypothetical protein
LPTLRARDSLGSFQRYLGNFGFLKYEALRREFLSPIASMRDA